MGVRGGFIPGLRSSLHYALCAGCTQWGVAIGWRVSATHRLATSHLAGKADGALLPSASDHTHRVPVRTKDVLLPERKGRSAVLRLSQACLQSRAKPYK